MSNSDRPQSQRNSSSNRLGLLGLLAPHRFVILTTLAAALAGTFLVLWGPVKLGEMTDLIMLGIREGLDMKKIGTIGLILLAVYLGSFALTYMQGFLMSRVVQTVTKSLRRSIGLKINRVPLAFYDKASTGDIMSIIANDVMLINECLNQVSLTFVNSVILFFGAMGMMLWLDPFLAGLIILTVLVGVLLMGAILLLSGKYFAAQQNELGELNGLVEEIYSGQEIVASFNAHEKILADFGRGNEKLYRVSLKAEILADLLTPVLGTITCFGYVVVCIGGAFQVMSGQISFGLIVAFLVYLQLFTQPLTDLLIVSLNLQRALAAGKRVRNFLAVEELDDESGKTTELPPIRGDVEFRDVSFGYTPDRSIIKNFSLKIEAGRKIAIVGSTGAGKTTLVQLLMRFYELHGGEILIDGVSTREMTREAVHSLFCMVLQDTWLFQGTIRENIVYNRKGISDEKLRRACEAVGAHHFILGLENGYETRLDEDRDLSAGKKQLLVISRALLDEAPMLILDEATSSIDTRTEQVIQEAVDKLTKGRTSFVIAHRFSTIRNADLILVIKDGAIVESGNHAELLARNGVYAELYNEQFA